MNVVNQISSSSLDNEHLAIILGFLALLSFIAILASCRIIPAILRWLHREPWKSPFYQTFYKGHTYFWWAFGMMLALHFPTAFLHIGFPASGDPEATLQWAILGLALSSVLSFLMVLFSCRIMVTIGNVFAGKSPLENRFFKWFYTRHGLWWWLFALSVIGHVTVASVHTGIWPT